MPPPGCSQRSSPSQQAYQRGRTEHGRPLAQWRRIDPSIDGPGGGRPLPWRPGPGGDRSAASHDPGGSLSTTSRGPDGGLNAGSRRPGAGVAHSRASSPSSAASTASPTSTLPLCGDSVDPAVRRPSEGAPRRGGSGTGGTRRGSSGASSLSCGSCLASDSVCIISTYTDLSLRSPLLLLAFLLHLSFSVPFQGGQ